MKQPVITSISVSHIIFGVSIFIGLSLRMALAFIPGYLGDQIPWAILARNAILHGLSHVYALTLAEPWLGVYPPLYHYLLALVGAIYQGFFSSSFTIYSFPLNFLLKLIPILGDCLVGMLIY